MAKMVHEEIVWKADGRPVRLGVTRAGEGPSVLLLPALSSISAREEMEPLQARLSPWFSTLSVDWPGFGTLPRPRVEWRPEIYWGFLDFLLKEFVRPVATITAGHGASYVLGVGADGPPTGALCLLSPTWHGPLPTMAGKRAPWQDSIVKAVDLPIVGPLLYRLNVNRPVIGMMARGHVYENPAFLTPERMAAKRAVTGAKGARHGSVRFVTGALDLFTGREGFLGEAENLGVPVMAVWAAHAPAKSRAEMEALGALPNVESEVLPRGKLSFYEEFPDDAATAILPFLHKAAAR